MKAEHAGKLVSRFINRQWPESKRDIYQILKLGINKAWNEGKWLGMTQEGFVPVRHGPEGYYIIGPYDHPILLAINTEGKPQNIRSKHFMFHRNGNGDVRDRSECKWNRDIYDLGEQPILTGGTININDGVLIGVRAIGAAGPNEKIHINGSYTDDMKIYSYKLKEAGLDSCACTINKETIDTVNGIELDITSKFNYICNIEFGSISSISKTVTRTPVEVIAIDKTTGKGQQIALLQPNQRYSKYRKYLLPDDLCKNRTCVHGLFKTRQQEDIVNDQDEIIIHNEEALISLAMAIDMIYYKNQVNEGAGMFLQAISILDKEKREEESPEVFPVQIERILNGDMPEVLNYIS
jgi:hypothetical protein